MENCITPKETDAAIVLVDEDQTASLASNVVISGEATVSLANGAQIPCFNAAADMIAHMDACVRDGQIMHYLAQLTWANERAHVSPTALFPLPALEAYTVKNLGQSVTSEQAEWFNGHRGGGQGDYSVGMADKIAAVVKCLQDKPSSKRAYIIIPNNTVPEASCDADAKCMQLLNIMLETNEAGEMKLNASVVFRAQAVEIFPKNIHFIGELLNLICRQLGQNVSLGHLLYHACFLVSTRDA